MYNILPAFEVYAAVYLLISSLEAGNYLSIPSEIPEEL